MLRKISLIASSLLAASCVNVPAKPSVTLCVLDFPQNQAICGVTGATDPAAEVHGGIWFVPLSDLDKATAFAPKEWEKVENYIHLMESFIRNNCQ